MTDWERIHRRLEADLGEAISIDSLTGAWKIAQRVAGHRHSSDDVLTAHYALRLVPDAELVLDLGTGIGTVGLMVLSQLSATARLVGVEAQAMSFRLLLANIEGNGVEERVEAKVGDLRDFVDARRFRLITGSPPYFPLGSGVLPDDPQKVAARFEVRGDVSDYARAAALHLTDDGTFVFCFPTPQRERALAAIAGAGLCAVTYQDVVPRDSLAPLFTLFAARRAGTLVIEEPFYVRQKDGDLTDQMRAVRRSFGFVT
ncbi:MAG: methyltransferase [Myxococcota bacterium]|nr:methyltransferase [Deltaproteobacteria bacterium]MDQ3339915.1 methyltransferase [Myxococcota bacterium]